MKEPAFDIFSGGPDKDPIWIETVEGLSQARERMHQLAAANPGPYFLYSVQSQAVLARVETKGPAGKAHSSVA
jgi:hypothetical protein